MMRTTFLNRISSFNNPRQSRIILLDGLVSGSSSLVGRVLKRCAGVLATTNQTGQGHEAQTSEDDSVIYGLGKNCMFKRCEPESLRRKGSESRNRCATMFGQPLIFDFDYDELNLEDCGIRGKIPSLCEQVSTCYHVNRFQSKSPFQYHFVNFDPNRSPVCQFLVNQSLKHLFTRPNNFLYHTTRCFMDIFPPEKLVYLSPDADDILEEFNEQDIYIIGVLNDKFSKNKNASAKRAAMKGIRSAQLPLDRYYKVLRCGKSLCLNHVSLILNKLKDGASWYEALKKVSLQKENTIIRGTINILKINVQNTLR